MNVIKSLIILSKIEHIVFIHKIFLSNRHYIFESTKTNFLIYFYIIDTIINDIFVRNDNNEFIKISRSFCFEKLIKLDYFEIFLINHDLSDLIVLKSKSQHKVFWFLKILNVTFYINIENSDKFINEIEWKFLSNSDIYMTHNVTTHNSFTKAI